MREENRDQREEGKGGGRRETKRGYKGEWRREEWRSIIWYEVRSH